MRNAVCEHPQAIKRRIQRLRKEMRDAGYSVEIKPLAPAWHGHDFRQSGCL